MPKKGKKPNKLKTNVHPVPDIATREFDMNQPTKEEDSDEDGKTLNDLLNKVDKDNVELKKKVIIKEKDDEEDNRMMKMSK